MGTQATFAERDRRLARCGRPWARPGWTRCSLLRQRTLVDGPRYWRYFTDFHIWGHDGLLCIPKDDEPFLVFSSYAVTERIAARGWVTEARGRLHRCAWWR
ncbi:MAG: hypothetical protein R2873_35405 [Caldilineaceae bacterium]